MLDKIINLLNTKYMIKLTILLIILDIILGSIRALKDHKWNSTFGINGILRKSAMIICMIFFVFVDYCVKLDLLFFIPKEITEYIHLNNSGVTELFGIMFFLYEATSILKNMLLCGLPIPSKLKEILEKLLNKMTTELENKKESDKNE